MYLNAFPQETQFGQPVRNTGADPDSCRQAGGVPSHFDQPGWFADAGGAGRPTYRNWTCTMPSGGVQQKQEPTNITVTVPTSTNVSPQVSPQFIQQQQPTNSPIGAELRGPGADAEALAAQERMRQAELIDMFRTLIPPPAPPQQVIVPHTTTSADEMNADVAMAEQPVGGFPILPLLLAAGVGAIILARKKGKGGAPRKRRSRR